MVLNKWEKVVYLYEKSYFTLNSVILTTTVFTSIPIRAFSSCSSFELKCILQSSFPSLLINYSSVVYPASFEKEYKISF